MAGIELEIKVGEAEDGEVKELLDLIMETLLAIDKGEAYDRDGFEEAVVTLTATKMVEIGCDIDDVIDQFETREYNLRAAYSPATDELSFGIDWLDEPSVLG